jgi:hypothetical protein
MTRQVRVAVWTCIGLCLAACAPSVGAHGTTVPAPTALTFVGDPDTQPTILSGRGGWPIIALDPNVYVDDEGFHLFYTTIFCQLGPGYTYSWNPEDMTSCNILHTISAIGYAFSSDQGRTWQFRHSPIVFPGDSGFDSAKIETANVFRLGDTLYLTYSADGDRGGRKLTQRFQIGVATLTLGRRSVRTVLMDESTRFERRANPLLAYDLRPGQFDNNVQEPSVVVRRDSIELYYIGLGLRLPEEPIDAPGQGIQSVGMGRAVFDRHLNLVSRSASAILSGVNITEVRYFDTSYHLFATTMSTGEAHQGEAISYATSDDGVHWTTPRVILSPGSAPGFNDWGLMAPTAAVDGGRVVLFYTAWGTVAGACVPVGPGGRFGIPMAGGSKCMFATVGRAVSAAPASPRR